MTLLLGMILDAIFGEPKWIWSRLPHPAVLMGQLIGWADQKFNRGPSKRRNGILLMLALGIGAMCLGWVITAVPGIWLDVVVVAILLAQRSLVEHVQAVADALRLSVGDARRAVAMIVGRDTTNMDDPAISRSAIESAAENLSDGVVAPIFWCALGGLPGLLVYKITNTADSMIGYKTPKHADFGWAAARFDDLLNFIPARLTALLIWVVTRRPDPALLFRDAPLHRSPNAGWPEAAMAHGIGVALSGPRSYDGRQVDYPFVNAGGNLSPGPDHIDQAVQVLWRTWFAALLLIGLLAVA
ncbi:adenosylcobinamide-phosphate synthase CbiB [Yoonia litorea]|uniref:Cobalamin biosynthesis protein CobD n=1 Tax=Yoonia litorea TaxID=1123755 RepID=A0A1I6N0Q1_9RHOB|nr:adenosylcobinamide-phosphate synthase CbiB [Yoonia litorea]SFS21431.1 adenosylcobinamide-phosphate synthase [Yoonia litorea]